ncbi:MAG: GntR family transcriptional regulator [Treponemataceae bacterium]
MESNDIFEATEPRSTAVEQVVDAIRTSLVQRKLKPGDLIPSEGELADMLHVGRGSIREAMKILSAFGVIDIRRGYGTYVATTANKKLFDPLMFRMLVSQSDIAELVELRIMVETGVVSLLLQHLDAESSKELEDAYLALKKCIETYPNDNEKARPYDVAFHAVMGRATKNLLVQNLYAFVIELLAPTMQPGHGLEAHGALVDALKKGDEAAALEAIRVHDVIWRALITEAAKNAAAP